MKKLEIAKDVMITSECWSYDKFAIMQTSPHFDVWLASHMNIYMEKNGGVVFGTPGQLYPLSYFSDLLDISEIDIFEVEKDEIVDLLMNQIDQGYYVALEMNLRKLYEPETEDFYLHERLIYGYDEAEQVFFAMSLGRGGFEEEKIGYSRMEEAYDGARDFFVKDYRRRYWMRRTLFGITRMRLTGHYENENAYYDCLKKIQNYIDISIYKEQKLAENFRLEDVTTWYLGSACSIALADSIKNGIVDLESANRDYKFTYLSALKIHESRNMLLRSMKWMAEELHVSNSLLIRILDQYHESCSQMQSIIGMMQKFRFTQDINLLLRAGKKMEQIYAADQKILRDFVRNMADCYMDTAFGHGVDLLIKLEHSGNNTIRWRKVRKEDASFLYNLMNTPEIAGRLHENPTTVDDWAKTIERLYQDDDEEGYIILAQDVPVGWIRICGLLTVGQSVVYINSFVLTPVHQGRGIGEYVLKETVKTLKLRGYIRVSIHISQENIQAKRCCQKCGFEVTEEAERQMLDGTVVKCYMMEVLCY